VLNLNQLRIFYHVAKRLSFTDAGKDLFISQPAVTNQIKSFEDYWGLKLFGRKGQKIYLTEEGKAVYQYAQTIFEYEKKIEDLMKDMKEMRNAVLRIGTTRAYARSLMPMLITRFHKCYPRIKVKIDEGSSKDIIENLLSLKNEVAIIVNLENPAISSIPLCNEEVVLIAPLDHPLLKRRAISFKDITQEPIIIKEEGSGTRRTLEKVFDRNRFKPNLFVETGNTDFIKQLVREGQGISFLSREAVETELREGKIASVSIKEERIFLEIVISHVKERQLSLPAEKFVTTLKQLVKEETFIQGIAGIKKTLLSLPYV
jgi:DNA-binding transcriptional LysR family regulator